MKNILKIGYYLCLVVLGITAILVLISVLPIPGNFKVKIVLSGSMEPTIKTGSLVVIKPVDDYQIGDIITFQRKADRSPTTHRIEEIRVVGGIPQHSTKGDANNNIDRGEIQKEEILGKALFSIPYLGYVVHFTQNPFGFALLIIVPAAIIVLGEIKKIYGEIKKKKESQL